MGLQHLGVLIAEHGVPAEQELAGGGVYASLAGGENKAAGDDGLGIRADGGGRKVGMDNFHNGETSFMECVK